MSRNTGRRLRNRLRESRSSCCCLRSASSTFACATKPSAIAGGDSAGEGLLCLLLQLPMRCGLTSPSASSSKSCISCSSPWTDWKSSESSSESDELSSCGHGSGSGSGSMLEVLYTAQKHLCLRRASVPASGTGAHDDLLLVSLFVEL